MKKILSGILLTSIIFASTQINSFGSENMDDVLSEEADQYSYLNDSTEIYHGEYNYNYYDDYSVPEYDPEDSVPLDPLGYKIADFDGDGDDELLIVK
ncbi:MAG: hypothetical protein ACI4CS_09670, partial [Candidatus Weimeria sp.]